eukprot:TRINITY_DN7612_c0_g1_i1.p1 TRINITY_DN7612_c0_g1~~TRINITY_DN7612_c0_g1_i1.p1  ORF type:complete len:498 (-),score=111.30 TRINITY_DN7612_c0_g1_i1:224-1717(-)
MYHLYPTGFEENCIPTQETGEDGGAALVDQKSFFRMMQAVERAGIPTRFPHPSGLYELLASKRWTYYMSLVPHLNVPPTVSVPRALIESCHGDAKLAAGKAFMALNNVRRRQHQMRGEPDPPTQILKGVAKLGFSWEALDVKFWQGAEGLETAIHQLSQAIEISGELTAQPHDLEAIIVQEYVPHDLEMRLYFVEGKVEATIFTKFCKIKENLEFGDFKESFVLEDAARMWMSNDVEALKDGQRKGTELGKNWLDFLQAQTCEMLPAIRFDFFVKRTPQGGTAEVWTLEICELGFSMLGEKSLPNKVFAAMLRSCVKGPVKEVVDSSPKTPTDPAETQPKAKPDAPGAAAPGPKPVGAQAASPANEMEPAVIHIRVPKSAQSTREQEVCTGAYTKMAQIRPQGQPVWANAQGTRFLYLSHDDYWYVGDEEECEAEFDADSGYIRQQAVVGFPPSNLPGVWERGPEWDEDDQIVVSVDPDARPPPRAASKGKGKKGKR